MVDGRCTQRYNEIKSLLNAKTEEKDMRATEWESSGEKFNGNTIYHKFFDLTVTDEYGAGKVHDLVIFTVTNDDKIEFFEARGVWADGYGNDLVQVGHGGIDNILGGESGFERSQSSVVLIRAEEGEKEKLVFRSWTGSARFSAPVRIEARVSTVSGDQPE
jgi:hypothetical protein